MDELSNINRIKASDLIKTLQTQNIYSEEIDGIDENGQISMKPDGSISAKEWEYFFKRSESFPMTIGRIASDINEVYFYGNSAIFLANIFMPCIKSDSSLNNNVYHKFMNLLSLVDSFGRTNTALRAAFLKKLLSMENIDYAVGAEKILRLSNDVNLDKGLRKAIMQRYIIDTRLLDMPEVSCYYVKDHIGGKCSIRVELKSGIDIDFYSTDIIKDNLEVAIHAINDLPNDMSADLKYISVGAVAPKTSRVEFVPFPSRIAGRKNGGSITVYDYDYMQLVLSHEMFHMWEHKHYDMTYLYYNFFSSSSLGIESYFDEYGSYCAAEDFATGEKYYTDAIYTRQRIRQQMDKGSFDLAIRYLFMKHIVFAEKEFNTSDSSLPLEYAEVEQSINIWMEKVEYKGDLIRNMDSIKFIKEAVKEREERDPRTSVQ